MFFKARFSGQNRTMEDMQNPPTPFKLSERTECIANWESIVDSLPEDWDRDEFHIDEGPYAWCDSLSPGCDCRGSEGGLGEVICSAFGTPDEVDKRASKSDNARHLFHVEQMEDAIRRQDASRAEREEKLRQEAQSQNQHNARPAQGPLDRAISKGLYCYIHGHHHSYGSQPIQSTKARLLGAHQQISNEAKLNADTRRNALRQVEHIGAALWLKENQYEECADRVLQGSGDVPEVIYKYVPRRHIGRGIPDSLRATQLLALNDDMECSIRTFNASDLDSLEYLRVVQSRFKEHLHIDLPWDRLLSDTNRHGSPILAECVQSYLNDLVGVVSFGTDPLVPTMWAHYAQNTGIVVGYDTSVLRRFGFELRPVVYSELAPIFRPLNDNIIEVDFVDREQFETRLREGNPYKEGTYPILTSSRLASLDGGWKSLSRLLFVKGSSWSYEKEVRLLVDMTTTRDTTVKDGNGWPIRVMDRPPEAIKEICHGTSTKMDDVDLAIEVGRRGDNTGLTVTHVRSHCFVTHRYLITRR